MSPMSLFDAEFEAYDNLEELIEKCHSARTAGETSIVLKDLNGAYFEHTNFVQSLRMHFTCTMYNAPV